MYVPIYLSIYLSIYLFIGCVKNTPTTSFVYIYKLHPVVMILFCSYVFFRMSNQVSFLPASLWTSEEVPVSCTSMSQIDLLRNSQ